MNEPAPKRNADIVVIDPRVSWRHGVLRVEGNTWILEDLESTNGTRVNGMLITVPTAITNGNRVELGSEVLLIKKRNASVLTVRISRDQRPPG